MAFEIIWTAKARISFLRTLGFLDKEWSRRVAVDFNYRVEKVLRYLRRNPRMGKMEEKLTEDVRSYLVTRHTKLFYRFVDNEI